MNEEQKNRLDQDIKGFVAGKKRLYHIKRWIETETDELRAEKLADYIAARFREHLLGGPKP